MYGKNHKDMDDDYKDDAKMYGKKKPKHGTVLDKETREAMERGDKWAKEHRSG